MAVEAYEIGVNLVANATRVTGPIGEMIEALERLLSAQREAQAGFDSMVSPLGSARRMASGLADDMERAARAAREMAASSGRFGAGAPSGGEREGGRAEPQGGVGSAPILPPIPPENIGRSAATSPSAYNGPHAVNPGEVGEGVMAARGALSGLGMPRIGPLAAGMAAYAGIHGAGETLGAGFRQTGQYDQTFLGMQGDPMAAANMAAIQATAQQAMRENRYLSPVDAAKMAQEAFEVSGGHMEEQAPVASLINRVDRSFQLMGKSPEEAMRESIAFIRAQDISNRFYDPHTGQFSMERASRSTDSALGMLLANRQFMRGQNFQSFATSAGLAAQSMSDEGMLNMAHFIDVNPRKAGMQVRSFENLFAGDHSRMTDKDFAYFSDRLHLTDRDGRFIGQQQLTSDPIGWINHYMSPLIATHPELLGHIQRMNVSDLAGEATGAEGNIARQSAAAMRTNAAQSVNALAGGQFAQSLAMHTAWERLEFTIGRAAQGPFISSLQALTGVFNGISDFVGKHPDDVRQFADDISALIHVVGGIAGSIGAVLDHIPGPLRRILESAAAGAATGAIGGSVLPGAGTAVGAIGGAVVGGVFGVAHEGYHQANRISAMQSTQAGGTNTQHVGTANISLNLNGREIASAVQDVQFRQAQQDMRASGTAPDVIQHPQVPGRAIGR